MVRWTDACIRRVPILHVADDVHAGGVIGDVCGSDAADRSRSQTSVAERIVVVRSGWDGVESATGSARDYRI